MFVKTVLSKWADPASSKIPAGLVTQSLQVLLNKFLLLFFLLHPELTGNDKGGHDPALRAGLDNSAPKLSGTSPPADTLKTVRVVAAGEDPEPPLRGRRLLQDHLHADAAGLVLARLEGKGLLHLAFEC